MLKPSNAVAVTMFVPSDNDIWVDQFPAELAVVVPTDAPLTNTSIVEFGSEVPVIVWDGSDVDVPSSGDVITGTLGATVSTT